MQVSVTYLLHLAWEACISATAAVNVITACPGRVFMPGQILDLILVAIHCMPGSI